MVEPEESHAGRRIQMKPDTAHSLMLQTNLDWFLNVLDAATHSDTLRPDKRL